MIANRVILYFLEDAGVFGINRSKCVKTLTLWKIIKIISASVIKKVFILYYTADESRYYRIARLDLSARRDISPYHSNHLLHEL